MKPSLGRMSWPLLMVLLSACVTINIYFPAAAAEEAARVIVRDVLQGAEQAPAEQQKDDQGTPASDGRGADPQSALAPPAAVLVAARLLEWLVPEVRAGQADINIDTPAIARLRASMQRRQRLLAPWYRSGAIGFNEKGLVQIRNLKKVPLKDRNRLRKLVADENRDRNALYREIARANGHPEWEPEIRATFARIWIEEAPAGYWYHKNGAWHRK